MEIEKFMQDYIIVYQELFKNLERVRVESVLIKLSKEAQEYFKSIKPAKCNAVSKVLFLFCNYYLENKKYPSCETCNKQIIRMGNGGDKLAAFCSQKCITAEGMTSKVKAAFLSKHGVENSMSIPGVREKIMKTNNERYSADFGWQNPEIRGKREQTWLRKYGVNNPNKVPSIIEKRKQTTFERHGVYTLPPKAGALNLGYEKIKNRLLENSFELLTPKEKYEGCKINYYEVKCLKCQNSFSVSLNNGATPYCTTCNPKSTLEHRVQEFINSLGITNLHANKRSILDDKTEIDIYLPDYKLGIELHGLYWHSVDKNYQCENKKIKHREKYLEAKAKEIRLLQIFEDELTHKFELVKSLILINLQKNINKIYARNCYVKELTKEEEKLFLEENHFQGFVPSRKALGLFHGDFLVQIMTFGRSRFSNKHDYELLRLCTIKNTLVVGGAEKLFKFFLNNHVKKTESIISYCDLNKFSGKIYSKLGFSYLRDTQPNYYYVDKKSLTRYSRLKFQKHKLKEQLISFDENKTEMENMLGNGYRVIYDSGNSVWEYVKK